MVAVAATKRGRCRKIKGRGRGGEEKIGRKCSKKKWTEGRKEENEEEEEEDEEEEEEEEEEKEGEF